MTATPPKRRLPRFGLKWLFVAMALVAVYFGSWPWLEERALRDVDSVAQQRFQIEWQRRRKIRADRQYQQDLQRVQRRSLQSGYVLTFDDAVIYDLSGLRPSYVSHQPTAAAPYIINAAEAQFQNDHISGWRRRRYLWLFGCSLPLPPPGPPLEGVPLIIDVGPFSNGDSSSIIIRLSKDGEPFSGLELDYNDGNDTQEFIMQSN